MSVSLKNKKQKQHCMDSAVNIKVFLVGVLSNTQQAFGSS